jgi:hypothetical protein
MENYVAAYPLNPNNAGKSKSAPQCSKSKDFCFLCEYSAGTPGDADVVGEMTGMARTMAEDGKEVPVIARALHESYETSARDLVDWKAPNGTVVQSPEWTMASISRHLLFSTELPVFGNAVGQILHSVIYTLNNSLIDKTTGLVVEDHRKALMDTIRTTAVWRTSQTVKRKRGA